MPRLRFPIANFDLGMADLVTQLKAPPGIAFKPFVRDRIEFRCGDVDWTLRRCWTRVRTPTKVRKAIQKGSPIPFSPSKIEFTGAVQLECDAEDRQVRQATRAAQQIAWLLQIARGRQTRIDRPLKRQLRAVAKRQPSEGHAPIKNQGGGELKHFIENAWPVFEKDPHWWRVTADWYAWACSISTVEVSGLIFSMLLDRLTTRLVKDEKYGAQIDPALDAYVKEKNEKRVTFEAEMTTLIQSRAAHWQDHHTRALVDTVASWNREPSYKKKIALAFEKEALAVPSGPLLSARHALAHGGELPSGTKDTTAYYSDMMDTVTRLLLRMLGYSGPYFATSKGVQELKARS